MKKLVALILAVMMMTMAFTCLAEGTEEKKLTIGFAHSSLSISWMADLQTLVEKKAEELGVELIVSNANNDTNQQISDIENLISKGVDGILIDAVDSNAAVAAVEKAVEAGIPVACTDRAIMTDLCVTFATGDNYQAGQEAGKYCAEVLEGKGNVVILRGPLGLDPQNQRVNGFKEIIEQYPDIKVISEQVADNNRAVAVSKMENILTAFADIDFVLGTNDEMMLGAINAMRAANRLEGVKSFTIGGHEETFTSIKDGEMSACVYYPSSMGSVALENLVKYLKGEQIEEKVIVDCAVVTPENVDEYLESIKIEK